MLKNLFNHQNVERIFFFLLVNETAYPTQIHTLLDVPLTPIQQAFSRLEKAGVVSSFTQGKTRIYRLNPSYPLRAELESLLRKAYTLLSPQEKKRYCFIHKPKCSFQEEVVRNRNSAQELLNFWTRLNQVKSLAFSVTSHRQNSRTEQFGRAEVIVKPVSDQVVTFQEKGHWFVGEVPSNAFSNSFRFTLDPKAALITLEHLRYGESHPVFLFHLAVSGPQLLESVDVHLCGDDTYLGHFTWDEKSLELQWRVIGPQKNDHLTYHYM